MRFAYVSYVCCVLLRFMFVLHLVFSINFPQKKPVKKWLKPFFLPNSNILERVSFCTSITFVRTTFVEPSVVRSACVIYVSHMPRASSKYVAYVLYVFTILVHFRRILIHTSSTSCTHGGRGFVSNFPTFPTFWKTKKNMS